MSENLERCSLCFGRGHRFRPRKHTTVGAYCYPCGGCGGRGERPVSKRPRILDSLGTRVPESPRILDVSGTERKDGE